MLYSVEPAAVRTRDNEPVRLVEDAQPAWERHGLVCTGLQLSSHSARAQNPNVDFSYSRAVTPPRCHVGVSCERIAGDRGDTNRGSLSV